MMAPYLLRAERPDAFSPRNRSTVFLFTPLPTGSYRTIKRRAPSAAVARPIPADAAVPPRLCCPSELSNPPSAFGSRKSCSFLE